MFFEAFTEHKTSFQVSIKAILKPLTLYINLFKVLIIAGVAEVAYIHGFEEKIFDQV